MGSKIQVSLVALLILLVMCGGLVLLFSHTEFDTAQASSGNNALSTQGSYSHAPGLPAIKPHVYAAQVKGSASSSSTTAQIKGSASSSFTVEDAKQYVMTHPIPQIANSTAGFTFAKAAFLPSQEVSQLMNGESTGVSDTSLLCYVELHGTVTLESTRGGRRTFHKVIEVFDAQTGNLLMTRAQ
jgi:hypothetical protein